MSPCGQNSLFSPQFIQLNGAEPGSEPAELQGQQFGGKGFAHHTTTKGDAIDSLTS